MVSGRQVMESGKQQPGLSLPKPRAPEKGLQPCLQASWAPHHLSIQGIAACLFLTEKTSCKFHPATDPWFPHPSSAQGFSVKCVHASGWEEDFKQRDPHPVSQVSLKMAPFSAVRSLAPRTAGPQGPLKTRPEALPVPQRRWEPCRSVSELGGQAEASQGPEADKHILPCPSPALAGLSRETWIWSFSVSAKIRALWHLILWQEASLWWLCGMRWNLARLLEELNPWSGNIMRTWGHSPFRVESRALIVGPRLRLAGSRLGAWSLPYHQEDLGGGCRDSEGLIKLRPQILNCSLPVELKQVRAINQHEKQMY